MRAWIFDLDGTLTVPMHDFAAIKRELRLPLELPILEGIETRPVHERADLHEAVRRWEASHLERARCAPHAPQLLKTLVAAGSVVGIVTRNSKPNALRTLDAIGLRDQFADDVVLGRDCAAPKPAPDALLTLLARWRVDPTDAVMIGDYVHDLDAGRAAGTATVWVDHEGHGRFSSHADRTIRSLSELP